jgi:hypothetical protein
MGSKGLIASNWASYRTEVVPKDAPDVQVTETRRAFYAGALTLITSLRAAVSNGVEATDADMKVMESVEDELMAFKTAVMNDQA